MTSVRSTIVLVVVAIIAVAAAVVVERSGGRAAHGAEPDPVLAPATFDALAVNAITLTRRDEAPLRFERGEQGWTQTAPVALPVDSFSVGQLVEGAADLHGLPLDEDLSPRALGLEPPQAVLELASPESSVTLRFGRRGFAGRAYVQVGDDPTPWVVDATLFERAVEADPREWRDRRIFRDAGVNSSRIVIDAGTGAPIVLERDRRTWRMTEPLRTRLDDTARDQLFQALGRAKSSGFIRDEPDDFTRFGLDDPVATLAITNVAADGANGAADGDGGATSEPSAAVTQTLLVGARLGVGSQNRFGMIEGRPVVVRLNEPVLKAFFRPVTDLVARTATAVRPADVKKVVMRTATDELVFERDLDRWVAPNDGGVEIARALPEGLLGQLSELRAPSVQLQRYPRDLEVALVILHGFDGRPIDTVRIARDQSTGQWIMENGDNVLRLHPAKSIEIPLTRETFGLKPN